MKSPHHLNRFKRLYLALFCSLFFCNYNVSYGQVELPVHVSGDTVLVKMAVIDQPIIFNRLGAALPTGMMYVLQSDLVSKTTNQWQPSFTLGDVKLRDDKRPRPIVLRANVGDVLKIEFVNYLTRHDPTGIVDAYNTDRPDTINQAQASSIYPATRSVGVHIMGTELLQTIASDASWVGENVNSLAAPGESRTYYLAAAQEGTFMIYSPADLLDNNGAIRAAQLSSGLFGTLAVQPPTAEWYRSQVSEEDLQQAVEYYIDSDKKHYSKEEVESEGFYNLSDVYPVVDYNANFNGTDKPILKMYKQVRARLRELVYSDLTAIITGPDHGDFLPDNPSPSFFPVPSSPNRHQPYREFAIHYHEAPYVVQSFPVFYDADGATGIGDITGTLTAGVDRFAINYGTGGIGAEIYANRIKVGPMADCVDCAYEEFFLSSWAVGDPATIVDIPANAIHATQASADSSLQNMFLWNQSVDGKIPVDPTGYGKFKATKVVYPDDPSNVYHSYMNDHVKFRVTHAGGGVTHVHHQHAHQWLHSPNNDNGHYLDSQTINPGSSYTLEIAYDGSGNLNKTVGDQIFHCHFYPHFAQGMWSMWRVHDVLELGTEVGANGLPVPGARALPDGEIPKGTAIPGIVPMPTLAMAPVPAKTHIDNGQVVIDDMSKNPGYPFFIPGVAGSRAPHPPLDFAHGAIYNTDGDSVAYGPLNGGLPRSVVVNGEVAFENHTIYDWTKITRRLQVVELPEEGTDVEKVAMATHAQRNHTTMKPDGTTGDFVLNGLEPKPGAPYADPAVNLSGESVGTKRTYKAANIQIDAVLNKEGWHYPQQRIISLWGDVSSNVSGIKPPEPFFFRANSKEYIEFWHTNLVPEYYELDDFQVRTPTDIIGQHIHLVKFDVTSSDGAANGWNYEDGSLASDMVRERIEAINHGGKRFIYNNQPGKSVSDTVGLPVDNNDLVAHAPNPVWGTAPAGQNWTGAQTTIQRWYADPLLNNKKEDRTLRTVFTHDHFGPSTHQQAGLYAGLLIEPDSSEWIDPVTGEQMGVATNGVKRQVMVDGHSMSVSDGGPTSWQANIVTADNEKSYREFMLEFQDSQLAYMQDSKGTPDPYPVYPPEPVTPEQHNDFVTKANEYRGWIDTDYAINPPKNNATGQFQPQLVSNGIIGTYSVNYRSEPVPLRVSDTAYNQVSGPAGDLSKVFSSKIERANPVFNSQPTPGGKISDSNNFRFPVDPLSPAMEPTDPYTPLFRAYEGDRIQVRTLVGAHILSHFFNIHGNNWLFEPSVDNSGFRSTQNMGLSEHFEMNFKFPNTGAVDTNMADHVDYLYKASAESNGMQAGLWGMMRAYNSPQEQLVQLPNNTVTDATATKPENVGCPAGAPVRSYDVTAISIDQYNNATEFQNGRLIYNDRYNNYDEGAIVYVRNEDLDKFKNVQGWEVEPLVLRAAAGECIQVNLTNSISPLFISNTTTYSYNNQVSVNLAPSLEVGLHTDVLSYNVRHSDGSNVGFNTGDQTIGVGESVQYEWYAGTWQMKGFSMEPTPVEYGTVILSSPDPMEQPLTGLFGAMVIEPEGSTWIEDENSRSSANVFDANGNLLFREFVIQFQDNLSVPSIPQGTGNPFATVTMAFNYKSEPMVSRFNNTNDFNSIDVADATSNSKNNGLYPETPHFVAGKDTPVRIRLAHAVGQGSEVFNLHGHVWQEEPYVDRSTKIGFNDMSQQFGFRDQMGALNSFDLLIGKAGGREGVEGDYLYNSVTSSSFVNGLWGIMSVTEANDLIYVSNVTGDKNLTFNGYCSIDPVTGKMPKELSIVLSGKTKVVANVNPLTGAWSLPSVAMKSVKKGMTITSNTGGNRTYSLKDITRIKAKKFVTPSVDVPNKKHAQPDPNRNPGMAPLRVLGERRAVHNSDKKSN